MRKILLSISLMLIAAMSFGQNGNNPPASPRMYYYWLALDSIECRLRVS
ncbi:hypothetical protein [uncultured Tenacibaculum sp.]|nr:hypothetical protein [uncultured Tenacibaculum sp.]